MAGKLSNHIGQIGDYWLSRRSNSPAWCRTWYDAKTRQTRRTSLGANDFQEAQLRLAAWITQRQEMRHEHPEDVPLETMLVRYYQQYAKFLPSEPQARFALAKWSDFFPGFSVAELTPERQEAFIGWLRESGASDGYISRILSVGRAALNRGYKRGEIKSVPYIVDTQKGTPRERRLSLDEAAALFDAIQDDHLLMYTMLAFNTLARPEAVLELTRSQVDIENRLIHFNPPGRRQTKKYRAAVPITDTLLYWLRMVEHEHVVSYHGRQIKSIKTGFRAARKRAGLGSDVTPYTIRHTMATELRKRGVPAWEVAGMLGHRSRAYSTTEIYAKFDPDYLGKAVTEIDAYFLDLQRCVQRQLVRAPALARASGVPVQQNEIVELMAKSLKDMVGAAGIEPATPTMST